MTFSVLTQLFLTVFADTIREMYKEDRRRMRIVWEYCDMPGTLLAKYTKTGYPLMLSYRFYASVQEKITDPDNMHKSNRLWTGLMQIWNQRLHLI